MGVGIGAAVGAISAAVSSISIADVGIGVGLGAAVGAGTSAIEGKPILTGALEGGAVGGLTAGLADVGGSLGTAAGIGSTAGGALGGAAAGALGSQITGGNPVTGAVEGGVAGGVAGYAGAGSTDATTPGSAPSTVAGPAGATSTGGPGVGAVGTAAPSTVSLDPTTTGLEGSPELTGGDPGGTVGAAMAQNPLQTSGGSPGANLAGSEGGGVPSGTELSPGAATDLQGQQALSQTGDVTQTGYQAAASGGTNPPAGGAPVTTEAGLGSPGPDGIGTGTAFANSPELGGGAGQAADYPGATGANAYGGAGGVGTGAAGTTAAGGNTIEAAYNNPTFGTVGKALASNASWLAPVGQLGLAAYKQETATGPNTTKLDSTLNSQAGTLASNGAQLQSYLTSGTLPAGVQNSITSATNSAKASIRSQYAARGMSGSSAEAQDLANIDQQASTQGATIAQQLLSTGIQESQLAQGIYGQLLNQSVQQDQALSSAVGNFASSLVPKAPQQITINQAA